MSYRSKELDFIYKQLYRLDYPAIRTFCLNNNYQTDSRITKLINSKRIQHQINHAIQQNRDPIIEACLQRDADMVDELIKQGFDPALHENVAIRAASINGYIDVVDRLLKDPRVDPSVYRNQAIIYASENGYSSVVDRLLVDPRVNPSASDNYAIIQASHNGHLKVVKRLLKDRRVDPADQNNLAIVLASKEERILVVACLLKDSKVRKKLTPSELKFYAKQAGVSLSMCDKLRCLIARLKSRNS